MSDELACGHCRGEFVVYASDERGLAAGRLEEVDLLERADHLLPRVDGDTSFDCLTRRERVDHLLSIWDHEGQCDERLEESSEDVECEPSKEPAVVLLVEHRDEVFARIRADLVEIGLRVVRADSAAAALKQYAACQPQLVIASGVLPDQSSWLLPGMLRFVNQHVKIWIYQPCSSTQDVSTGTYWQVDQMLDYGGDLLGLSDTILGLMLDQRAMFEESVDRERSTGRLAVA